MEFVLNRYTQLVDLIKSMTPGARVLAVLLLLVTAISLAWLFQGQVVGSETYLMGGELFSPAQLRDMQAAFGKAGLEAELDGARVRVPRGQESKYMAALADAGALPAEFGHYMQQAVNTGGFLRAPRSQQEAAWRVAKQQDLQRIIGEMHGIEKAAVQIDEERIEAFPHDKKRLTAAVMIRPKTDQALDEQTVRTLREMLTSSFAGLDSEAVTIVDLSTNRHYAGASGHDAAATNHADHKRRHEQHWQHTIGHVLGYIPGVLISTNVEFDPERPTNQAQRVKVSVAVPNTYYEQVWQKEHVGAAGTNGARPDGAALAAVEMRERTKIEQLVANLLPQSAAADSARQVAVSTFYPLTPAPVTEPEWREKLTALAIEHARELALGGLAIVGLLVLRSMFRSLGSARPAASAAQPPSLSLVRDAFEESDSLAAESLLSDRRYDRAVGRGALAGELADAVRDDPEAAASVLKAWIGNAS